MATILRPKALRAGDVVAVAALSGGLDESEAEQFKRGVEAIEGMGFEVRISPWSTWTGSGGGLPRRRGRSPRSSTGSCGIRRFGRSSR